MKPAILVKMNGKFRPPLPPPPRFNDAKMAGFGLRAPSSKIAFGGKGVNCSFLFCPRYVGVVSQVSRSTSQARNTRVCTYKDLYGKTDMVIEC